MRPAAPPHASEGLPSPKRLPSARLLEAGLRAGRRNPPKHTLLHCFRASKGTLSVVIYGLRDRACTPKCLPVGRQALRHAGVAFCVGG